MMSLRDLLRRLATVWTGRPEPLMDGTGRIVPHGISEKRFLDVNGTRQGMFLRGRDPENPVLLYLHGGLPEYFLEERRPTPAGCWECWARLSSSPSPSAGAFDSVSPLSRKGSAAR